MTILLTLHILSATALISVSLAMVAAGILMRKIAHVRLAAAGTFIATSLSGVVMLFGGAALGHFCATMTFVTLVLVASRSFYVRRLEAVSPDR